jgi:PST family polysaccharide transporter
MGNGARAVVKIAVLAALGRLLTPVEFGIVAAAGVVVWLSMIFSSLGVGPALVQRKTLEPRHIATAFATSVMFGVSVALIVFLLAPWIALLFRIDGLTPVLQAMAVVFPIAGLSSVSESLLQRRLRFRSIASAELASYAIGYGAVGIGMALAGFGVWSLVGAEVTKATIKSGIFLYMVPDSKQIGFDRAAFGELITFGGRYAAGGFSTYLAAQGDNFIVARVLGASALGLYGRAYELMMVPAQALGVVLDKILFATMSQMQDESLRLTRAYRRAAALVALLVLPVSAATIVLAPEIIRALLGSGWEGAVRPLQVLGVAMYFRSGSMVGNSLANASGAVGRSAARTALYAVSVVVGAWIGSRWGLVGVASGVVGAVVLNFVVVFHLVHRLTGLPIREFLGVHVPALGLAAVIGVEAYGVRTVVGGTGNAAVLVLAAFAVLAATTVVLLVRLLPRSALGDEGTWMVHMVCANAPAPVQPYLRKALAVPA